MSEGQVRLKDFRSGNMAVWRWNLGLVWSPRGGEEGQGHRDFSSHRFATGPPQTWKGLSGRSPLPHCVIAAGNSSYRPYLALWYIQDKLRACSILFLQFCIAA